MNSITPTLCSRSSAGARTRFAARLSRIAAFACLLLAGSVAQGITVLWQAPNTTVQLGSPFAQLEFENPLAGTEQVAGYKVLEWRDADYAPGPPPWYDDWTVNPVSGIIDGNANEIYMRQQGQSAWTTTTVPSTRISIHLNADNNDGLADVQVDGVTIAKFDMWTAACCQTALILVQGLANTTHTVTVVDVGMGVGGTDVHVMGAAALEESQFKWNQPPVPAEPTNVFYGWNEPSMEDQPMFAADDWVCSTTNPVTRIRWWGSFLNWQQSYPPQQPAGFLIRFWTDVPKGADPLFPNFSHPGVQTGPTIFCANFTSSFAGWDYDPRSGRYEACFMYEQTLAPSEYFYQDPGPDGTNIYWLSIQAVFQYPTNTWGWKTRPRDDTSAAPDDAVVFDPTVPFYQPLFWPDETSSWDLAFELFSNRGESAIKWEQWPDLSPLGMDVRTDTIPSPPTLLADDFLCTSPGYITNITVWGSWLNDSAPASGNNVTFTLSIHDDIPGPPYSQPGTVKWVQTFAPGSFTCKVFAAGLQEGWLTPPSLYIPAGDTMCYQYTFSIPIQQAFYQEGYPRQPMVYWLDVQAQPPSPSYQFGWKTCITNWNDSAAWANAVEPYNGLWNQLIFEKPLDLAFRLETTSETFEEIKWSQPPVRCAPTNAFNGWNEESVMDSPYVVADDWVCTNSGPVTDIHWWGSFIGWSEPDWPALPDAFRIRIWSDIPAGTFNNYSQPGNILWETFCTNFTCRFVGWDIDPRDPNAAPEACFMFEQDLLEDEWWWQGPGTNIYWLSIEAVYRSGQAPEYPWGWKTRPRDPDSPAPDDAVRIYDPFAQPPGCEPIWWPDPTISWDLAFALTTRETENPTQDFGDAPAPYPTLLANNGASHTVVPGITLGANLDAESDGQPDSNALGDDNNPVAGPDDEDGVVLGTLLIPGEVATVQVTASTVGFLSAWMDFNADGSWATPGEQIFTDVPLTPGVNSLSFSLPLNAAQGAKVCARFRFSTATGLSFTGPAPDGEVEDYRWFIEELDFGDAPDPAYPTLYANNGARHVLSGLFLGAQIDAEPDGQPSPNAVGDDNNPPALDDEDGVVFTTALIAGVPASVQVTASGPGLLQGWIDFNRNGSWAEANEQIIVNQPVNAGANLITFSVPNGLPAGKTYARFRLSSLPNLSFTGPARDGEVEDYTVTLYPIKWLQAPEQGSEGVDVSDQTELADDFQCTQSGPITDIHFWGSFLYDLLPPDGPGSLPITLSIYDDVPRGPDNPYSHPGTLKWSMDFAPGQYQVGNNMHTSEWWHDPAALLPAWLFPGDTNMYQFDFYIDPADAFQQVEGNIYWLSVKYASGGANYAFGWKTTCNDWNDDACWLDASGIWKELRYGGNHPRAPESLNLAFALSGPEGLSDLDFGDAPSPYATLLANNGARHFAIPGFCLGPLEDTEADGQPHALALGDLPDEDGVQFTTPVLVGTQACVSVTLTAPSTATGLLDAWMDFNANGAWETAAGEQIFTNQLLLSGVNNLCFPVPVAAKLGTNFARFRLSSAGGLPPTGYASDGEVEDYQVTLLQRRLQTNIVITNIVVTNLFVTNQVVGLAWTYQNDVHYQVLSALSLGTNGSGGGILWSNAGPELIGPAHWHWETNSVRTQKFYRVMAPYLWP